MKLEMLDDYYDDFNKIKSMKLNSEYKRYILKEFFEASGNPWRVVGITHAALDAFASNNFKYVKGIQRAHYHDRKDWYEELLIRKFDSAKEWFTFYSDHDFTILAKSAENKIIKSVEYTAFPPNMDKTLFKSNRISWRYTIEEEEFLKKIHHGQLY